MMQTLGEAWRVSKSRIPNELLDAYHLFERRTASKSISKSTRMRLYAVDNEIETPPNIVHVDWRTTGVVPTPKYQGPYNTCTSFASVTTLESLHTLLHHSKIDLSPGFIHTCLLGRKPHQGASPKEALDAIAAHGIALGFPGDYPFPEAQCSTGNLYSVKRRVWLPDANAAMQVLANQGPIVADMFIEPSFLNLGPGEIYRIQPNEAESLHTVAVVGYDFSQQYWIISNSYGTGWGDGGFGFVCFGSGGLLDERGGWQVLI